MQVRWTEYAASQLDEIVDALLDRSPGLAQRVTWRILDRVGALADLPWSGPPWRVAADSTIRRLVVDDHVVIYRVVTAEDTVFVLAVRHGRQRPPDPDELPPQ